MNHAGESGSAHLRLLAKRYYEAHHSPLSQDDHVDDTIDLRIDDDF